MHAQTLSPAETMSPQATVTVWTALVALLMGATAVLTASLPAAPARAAFTSAPPPPEFIIPVARIETGSLADTWGAARSKGRKHEGIDIMAPAGRAVRAAADGMVVKLATNELGGTTLYQRDASGELVLYYAHLQRYATGMTEGAIVKQGDVIGYVGSTGNATTPHLHFEIMRQPDPKRWWGGKPLNPYPVLKAGMLADPVAQAAQKPSRENGAS